MALYLSLRSQSLSPPTRSHYPIPAVGPPLHDRSTLVLGSGKVDWHFAHKVRQGMRRLRRLSGSNNVNRQHINRRRIRRSRFGIARRYRLSYRDTRFCESAVRHLRQGNRLCDVSSELVKEWLDDIRDRIGIAATRFGGVPRDFASTLVGCLVGTKASIFVHIGDGACVYRLAGDLMWTVPTWPAQGEYAATTFFVTDEPEPSVQFATVSGPIRELAVFSDGLERLALEFASKTAFPPFFEKMFAPLHGTAPGRDRGLSRSLKGFLDGPAVCDRTDDDKTLILAKRVEDA